MPLFRIYAERTLSFETEVEADSIDDARQMAEDNDVTWSDASGGRGEDELHIISIDEVDEDEADVPPL